MSMNVLHVTNNKTQFLPTAWISETDLDENFPREREQNVKNCLSGSECWVYISAVKHMFRNAHPVI